MATTLSHYTQYLTRHSKTMQYGRHTISLYTVELCNMAARALDKMDYDAIPGKVAMRVDNSAPNHLAVTNQVTLVPLKHGVVF